MCDLERRGSDPTHTRHDHPKAGSFTSFPPSQRVRFAPRADIMPFIPGHFKTNVLPCKDKQALCGVSPSKGACGNWHPAGVGLPTLTSGALRTNGTLRALCALGSAWTD